MLDVATAGISRSKSPNTCFKIESQESSRMMGNTWTCVAGMGEPAAIKSETVQKVLFE